MRGRWRVLVVAALVLYVTSPWLAVDYGEIQLGFTNPSIRIAGWDSYYGVIGFGFCANRDEYCATPGVSAFPFGFGASPSPALPVERPYGAATSMRVARGREPPRTIRTVPNRSTRLARSTHLLTVPVYNLTTTVYNLTRAWRTLTDGRRRRTLRNSRGRARSTVRERISRPPG